jgi:hypothetical protein
MSPKHIWLLYGYACSGKDTTGSLLQNMLGDSAHISSFASAAKDEVASMYELDRTILDSQEGKQKWLYFTDGTHKQVRTLLIEHAQGEKEKYNNPAIWAERLIVPDCLHFICTDWRFMSELECMRRRFPNAYIHTVHIRRSSVIPLSDPTEHELDSFPSEYIIKNDGSLLYLSTQIRDIIERIHSKISNLP